MNHRHELGQEQFDALLGLFSANQEEAGEKYEKIRNALIRYFNIKGCPDPPRLADKTINRVAAKLHTFDSSLDGQLSTYFYGFASNILLEHRREMPKEVGLTDDELTDWPMPEIDDPDEAENACLDRCLEQLPTDEKELIIEYYSRDKLERIELRQQICQRLNCNAPALYARISRIKKILKGCIEDCIGRQDVR